MSHEKGIEAATEIISAEHAYQLSYEAVSKGIKAYLDASGMVMVPMNLTGEMRLAAITCPLPSIQDNRPLYEICWDRMLSCASNHFQTPE